MRVFGTSFFQGGCRMTPHVTGYIPREERDLFERIVHIVRELPDIDLGTDEKGRAVPMSCHIITRALGQVFFLQYKDGYFCDRYCHTWLLTPAGHIIDPYPVATLGGPILMEALQVLSPAHRLYKTKNGRDISRGVFSTPWFRRSVERTVRAIRLIL